MKCICKCASVFKEEESLYLKAVVLRIFFLKSPGFFTFLMPFKDPKELLFVWILSTFTISETEIENLKIFFID